MNSGTGERAGMFLNQPQSIALEIHPEGLSNIQIIRQNAQRRIDEYRRERKLNNLDILDMLTRPNNLDGPNNPERNFHGYRSELIADLINNQSALLTGREKSGDKPLPPEYLRFLLAQALANDIAQARSGECSSIYVNRQSDLQVSTKRREFLEAQFTRLYAKSGLSDQSLRQI